MAGAVTGRCAGVMMATKKKPATTKKPAPKKATAKKPAKKTPAKKRVRAARARVKLFDIETAVRPIWQQQKTDTAHSYEAQLVYMQLGIDRSIAKAAEKLGKAVSTLETWAFQHCWSLRNKDYDAFVYSQVRKEQERKAIKAIIEARAEIILLDLEQGRELRNYGISVIRAAAKSPLAEVRSEVMTPAEYTELQLANPDQPVPIPENASKVTHKPHAYVRAAIEAIKTGKEMMRLAAGMVTETLKIDDPDATALMPAKGAGAYEKLKQGQKMVNGEIAEGDAVASKFDDFVDGIDFEKLGATETDNFIDMLVKLMDKPDDADDTVTT